MLSIKSLDNIRLNAQVSLKPDYLIHPTVSGNKYRKLKYNLEKVRSEHHKGILTFGGAFSNHIAATAAAGQALNIPTVGIIRGEELASKAELNATLSYAKSCGMHLEFVTRSVYKEKTDPEYLNSLLEPFKNFYILPEGGSNGLAVKGCEEILTQKDQAFDIICCAVGTGGTIAGLINASLPSQKIIGFPALKGGFLNEDICKFATQSNWELWDTYHFGGYAKVDSKLITFMNHFKAIYNIPLDPVYTAKMMYGIFDAIQIGRISKEAKVLAIHTGGLQGVEGMNLKLKRKQLELII
ncbi:pyridoxal-phosphate dependent enzyme [Flavobacteriaceae bacterium]|jgi:1-aminocyclopropane-1-carboxylate deaminase|nr:pyridoxal-phosphate dependent enzyme [Flavobacteriaceae bacterium]MDC1259529.1 pyridoxal-phosphate dependent enzyme [Flavobacteriaceae bacterium]MDG1384336.1 pyridoxal-phosphate dependent enzyme [Flavobacteriaceae bacterium]